MGGVHFEHPERFGVAVGEVQDFRCQYTLKQYNFPFLYLIIMRPLHWIDIIYI